MATPSNVAYPPRNWIPGWFATDVQTDYARNGIRFRAGLRCVDGDLTIFDAYLTDTTLQRGRVENTRRELLQIMYEHITKEIATLELEKE